jgi:hypothetical protein
MESFSHHCARTARALQTLGKVGLSGRAAGWRVERSDFLASLDIDSVLLYLPPRPPALRRWTSDAISRPQERRRLLIRKLIYDNVARSDSSSI